MQWACHLTDPPRATPTLPLAPACEATRRRGGFATNGQRVLWAWRWQLAVARAGGMVYCVVVGLRPLGDPCIG
jgi:hypothetical protein